MHQTMRHKSPACPERYFNQTAHAWNRKGKMMEFFFIVMAVLVLMIIIAAIFVLGLVIGIISWAFKNVKEFFNGSPKL